MVYASIKSALNWPPILQYYCYIYFCLDQENPVRAIEYGFLAFIIRVPYSLDLCRHPAPKGSTTTLFMAALVHPLACMHSYCRSYYAIQVKHPWWFYEHSPYSESQNPRPIVLVMHPCYGLCSNGRVLAPLWVYKELY